MRLGSAERENHTDYFQIKITKRHESHFDIENKRKPAKKTKKKRLLRLDVKGQNLEGSLSIWLYSLPVILLLGQDRTGNPADPPPHPPTKKTAGGLSPAVIFTHTKIKIIPIRDAQTDAQNKLFSQKVSMCILRKPC